LAGSLRQSVFARNLELDLAGIGDDRLLGITISPVARLFSTDREFPWCRRQAERDVHRLIADQCFIPDLNPQGIEENQRVDCFERAGLPG
jgi:hypothetical protein